MRPPGLPPRRRMLCWLGAALPAAGLAACSLGRAPRMDFHLLRDPGGDTPAVPGPAIDKVLLVASGGVPGLYDSDRMVFSVDGRSRSYFQFGHWGERPAQSLLPLAERRLARSKRFRDVVISTSGVRGDLLLSLRLDELYLDTSIEPGQLNMMITAELIDWRKRDLLARRSFVQAAPVPQRDAGGLAEAASRAMGVMLDELVPWAAASAGA